MSRSNAHTSGTETPLRKKMQFNKLNVVNGALSTDASTVGHVLSALK